MVIKNLKAKAAAIAKAAAKCAAKADRAVEASRHQEPRPQLPRYRGIHAIAKSMLNKFTARELEDLKQKVREIGTLRVTSLFSGSELQSLCGTVLFSLLEGEFICVACSEHDEAKANFIKNIVHAGSECCCIFKSVSGMHQPLAPCWAHGGECAVPEATLAIGGWSCKGLSQANMHAARGGTQHAIRAGTTSSGSTFKDMMGFLDSCPSITVLVAENVAEILKAQSDNALAVAQTFAEHGWIARTTHVKYNLYGNRTMRHRAWIYAVHADRLGLSVEQCNEMLARAVATLERMQVPPPLELEQTLLSEGDSHVVSTRVKMLEKRSASQPGEAEWQRQLSRMLERAGLTWRDCRPPAEHVGEPGFESLLEREKMTFAMTLLTHPKATFIDVGQALGRAPVREDDFLHSFTQKALPYHVGQKRIITGMECLMVHGFPREALRPADLEKHGVPDSLLRDLAGNSFSTGAVLAAYLSLLSALPATAFKSRDDANTQGDEDAHELVDSLMKM
jgi:site-specific DNA-cytosine methylase